MGTKVDSLRTQALDLLRFPLAIVILSIHIILGIENDIIALQNNTGGEFFISNAILQFIRAFFVNQSVPVYFFISGYVFFLGLKDWDKEKYINKLKNRINSLLIPYIVWNTLMLIILLLAIYSVPSIVTANGGNFTLEGFLSAYWKYDGTLTGAIPSRKPIDYPLWFVRDLMIIVLFAPILYNLLKKRGKTLISLFIILWAILKIVHIEIIPSADGLVFFSMGAYMSLNSIDMMAQFGKYKKTTAIAFVLLGISHIIAQNYGVRMITDIIKIPMIFTGLFFVYNVSAVLITTEKIKISKFLSSASFFLYISHPLICSKILFLCKKIIKPNSDIMLSVCYLLSVILTVLILLIIFKTMQRHTPKLLSVMVGRKG